MPSGAELITMERQRQIEREGWTPEHDATHWDDDLARAAVCYALPSSERPLHREDPPRLWPWYRHQWKPVPGDRVRELTKAGALIAAEIDRPQGAQP